MTLHLIKRGTRDIYLKKGLTEHYRQHAET